MNTFWVGTLANWISGLIRSFDADRLRRVLDKWIDVVEDECDKSPNKLDDTLVKPALVIIRKLLSIEETPGGEFEDKPITISTTGDIKVVEK
jgi:hypothetical protein